MLLTVVCEVEGCNFSIRGLVLGSSNRNYKACGFPMTTVQRNEEWGPPCEQSVNLLSPY